MAKRPPKPPKARTRIPRAAPSRRPRREDGDLPPVFVAEVVERDADGDLFVRPAKHEDGPLLRLAPDREETRAGAPALGDRVLVRLDRLESGETQAKLVKKLGQSVHRILGVVRKSKGEARVEPVDRRVKDCLT